MKIRSFLAIELAKELTASAKELIRNLSPVGASVKWVESDGMHLTLKFFGEIEELKTYEISKAVSDVVAELEPFEFRVEGVGAFPDVTRPRTIWVGVSEGSDALCRLQAQLDSALGDLGFPPERRRFHPHLTLGRIRERGDQASLVSELQELQSYDCGSSRVEQVVFFRSELHRRGPVYTKLATCTLEGSEQ